jgi:quercetin dioxygenase-like cupin family protein
MYSNVPVKQGTHMSYTVVNKDELRNAGSTSEFEGYLHGDTEVSFILVDMQPGEGVRLHKHPYQEIFIIQEGTATYTVGTATLEARAGQIISRSSIALAKWRMQPNRRQVQSKS